MSSQPPPSPAVTERLGSLSEPSLTTGAALEKYQIVAQKVNLFSFYLSDVCLVLFVLGMGSWSIYKGSRSVVFGPCLAYHSFSCM